MLINVWIALSTQAKDIVVESLRWDEETQGPYTGPLRNRSRRLFEYMQDEATRRKLFTRPTLAGTTYHLWSVDFDDKVQTLQLVRDEIDYLIGKYPNQIAVLGAWHIDTGEQVGTRNGGDPVYPIPNFLWRFLPDPLPDGASPTSNVDMYDVNKLFGQADRDFS